VIGFASVSAGRHQLGAGDRSICSHGRNLEFIWQNHHGRIDSSTRRWQTPQDLVYKAINRTTFVNQTVHFTIETDRKIFYLYYHYVSFLIKMIYPSSDTSTLLGFDMALGISERAINDQLALLYKTPRVVLPLPKPTETPPPTSYLIERRVNMNYRVLDMSGNIAKNDDGTDMWSDDSVTGWYVDCRR